MKRFHRGRRTLSLAALGATLASATLAVVLPQNGPGVRYAFRAPELTVRQVVEAAASLQNGAGSAAQRLGSPSAASYVDLRTGRWATLQPATPLLPGRGVGNSLTWDQLGIAEPRGTGALADAAWDAFASWLDAHARDLGVDPAEVVSPGRVTVLAPDYIQIVAPRRVAGLPVRDAGVSATIRYGNLVLVGFENWADLEGFGLANLTADQAIAVLGRMIDQPLGKAWKNPELAWIPVARGESVTAADLGAGLGYRLAWVLRFDLATGSGRYEALVDARDGTYLSFVDTAEYVATPRKVTAGVYPVSNDGTPPDGTEQAGWPVPFETITTPGGSMTTDAGGNLSSCVDGSITSDLRGQYLYMNDTCGAASLSGTGDLDFGVSAGTDCITPGVGGAGNTHSSRSGFYELNQMKAMARGLLPDNLWLQDRLTANMNLNQTCNAFWDGINVNFFKSGGGCRNTGEIAAVFDHEWGHGLDDNDASPGSNPGETTADVYASIRLDTSCIGRGFTSSNCGGYGNSCLSCTGVRDIDWNKRSLHAPTTVTWIDANCGLYGSGGPCGGEVHCEGYLAGEAVWDLWNRDLVAAPYTYSLDRAREIAAQMSFRGTGGVTSWYSCTQGSGGCGSTTGYKQYLAADDDNGNLNDGTPHMAGIYAAFNRHGIACSTPTVQDSGCTGAPTSAPTVTPTARDRGARLTWTPVSGAAEYRVYRTDGVFGCDFGKVLVATTTATAFDDTGLQNGRQYSYIVVPMGGSDVCFGVPSTCTGVTPAAGASLVPQVDQATFPQVSGDGDPFLDNCETIQLQLPLANTGTGSLTNVQILSATSPSHPATTFVSAFPVTVTASLASCATATAQLSFVPQGLAQDDVFELDLVLSATELAGDTRTVRLTYDGTESDLQQLASKTFDFEADAEGWTTIHGIFVRDTAGGGAGGSTAYMRSSAFLDQQCDIVRSPRFVPSATSTLQVYTNFNIEPFSDSWYDRANVSLIDRLGGRTLLTPSAGRAYNASGPNGTCGTTGQAGWAGAMATWATSDWNATAFQSAANAGKLMNLQVNYGTDPAGNNFGFHFDRATITDAGWPVADTHGDLCSDTMPFLDGFETGDTSHWSVTVP